MRSTKARAAGLALDFLAGQVVEVPGQFGTAPAHLLLDRSHQILADLAGRCFQALADLCNLGAGDPFKAGQVIEHALFLCWCKHLQIPQQSNCP
uniref:Uncharacterized protein n=1 Tax=Pseudomonas mosselii TaxID=78327 RepID=A0A514C817_9PSED|nr:hypothetical protein [Pseudomonas mosselii]